jgi:hypothetical protein
VADVSNSYTGQFLKRVLEGRSIFERAETDGVLEIK